jgi:hypothetical protein
MERQKSFYVSIDFSWIVLWYFFDFASLKKCHSSVYMLIIYREFIWTMAMQPENTPYSPALGKMISEATGINVVLKLR